MRACQIISGVGSIRASTRAGAALIASAVRRLKELCEVVGPVWLQDSAARNKEPDLFQVEQETLAGRPGRWFAAAP